MTARPSPRRFRYPYASSRLRVALLLRHGVRWRERNGYAGDYAAVLRLLLADGAPPPEIGDHLPDEMAAAAC